MRVCDVVLVKCVVGAARIWCCILYEVVECGLRCGLRVEGKVRYVVHVLTLLVFVLGDLCVICQRFV